MVAAARDDHGKERPAGECHAVGFLYHRVEAEHFRIHFQRGDSTRGDDHGAETVKDRFDSNGGVETGEVKNRVGNGGGVRFVGFEDQEKAFIVRCSQGSEGGYLLERLVVFNVREF